MVFTDSEDDEEEEEVNEPDLELLQIQKRKSTPKVVIQEFVVQELDDDEVMSSGQGSEDKKEDSEQTMSPALPDMKKRPSITLEKTHIEIDNVSCFSNLTF